MSKILQWNCRGLISKWSEMKHFFSVLAPVLIAIQETWFLPTDNYNFQLFNYTLYRYDETSGQRRHGGVALYVNNDYTHNKIDLHTQLQAVASTVYLNGRDIDICSIYIPPDFEVNGLLQHLNDLVRQLKNPYLLLGDFNAHSPAWWDGQTLDAKGRIMEDFIDAHRLVTLNLNQPTHFHLSHNTESAIDLTLSSPCLATWFEWAVDTDIHDSDHYPISLQFTFTVNGIPSFSPRWKLDKADWVKFTEECEFEYNERFDDPVQGIQFITDTMISAASKSIPITKPSRKAIPVPWWNNSVRNAVAKRKRSFRSYLRTRTEHALILRNRERANARRIIRSSKRESWQQLLSTLTASTPLGKIWDLIRRLSGKRSSQTFPVLRLPGVANTVIEPKQVVNCLAEKIAHTGSNNRYFPGFSEVARRRFQVDIDTLASNNNEVYNIPFKLQELEDSIASAGNTSVGPDKLHYSFFRHLSEHSKLFVLQTFTDLFRKHLFPDAWKESTVIALLKPGRARHDAASYRPIALSSCLGKLLERMVSKRLTFILEEQDLLSKFQCGFRKNHTPMDHLIRLESDIRKGYKSRQHTTAIFLDIKNAYDMVYKPALVYKIQQLGIRGNLAHYLCNFLAGNRRLRVKHRSILSDVYEIENGLPQGSCLSPILFNIMINDLFEDIPPGISFSLFADDSAIWCTTPDYDVGISRLQTALCKVERWSAKYGLEFSAEKSSLMIFSKFRKLAPERLPKLNNMTIPLVSHFKFLGVVLDPKLTMNKHVAHIQTKCKKRLNLFRCITSTPAGADRNTLLRLYKTIVLPIIEYGSIIYDGGSQPTLKKLEAIQNNFLRLALGAMKTSPVLSLQVDANVTPLHIRRMELTMRYFSKIKQFPNHAASKAVQILPRLHFGYLGRCEKRTGLTIASRIRKYEGELNYKLPEITPMPTFHIAPWMVHPLSISFLFEARKHSLLSTEVQQIFSEYQAKHPQLHFVYTDGSKKDTTTGIGIFSQDLPRIKRRLPDNTSVYSAELYAIFLALQFIDDNHIQQPCICSDSKSAIQGLLHPDFTQHLHSSIVQLHDKLINNGIQIQFLWIPGHSGITGNDTADHLAKEALGLPDTFEIPLHHSNIRSSVHYHCKRLWQRNWTTKGVGTQLHQIKPNIEHWTSSNRSSRKEEKALSRLRIGHTYLTHSFIFNHEPRPLCTICREVINIQHIILQCTKYNAERTALQQFCRMHNIQFTLSVILGDEHEELLKLLFIFLTTTDLLRRL